MTGEGKKNEPDHAQILAAIRDGGARQTQALADLRRELHDDLRALNDKVEQNRRDMVEVKTTIVAGKFDKRIDQNKERIDDVSRRLNIMSGGATVIGALFGWLASKFTGGGA